MIQVVNRAIDILELLAKQRDRLYTLSEISTQLGLNNGTCANIIKTLVNRGYIEQKSRKAGYCLGSMAYLLTGNYLYKREILEAAREPMKHLVNEFNEGAILSVLKDNRRIILHEIRSSHELQVVNKKEKDAYMTSTGRMILACLDKKNLLNYVQSYGLPSADVWPDIADQDDLILELQKIRKKNLAVQISQAQIVGMAVPLFKNKEIIGSLGIYLPQSRYTQARRERMETALQEAGKTINHQLNHSIPETKKQSAL